MTEHLEVRDSIDTCVDSVPVVDIQRDLLGEVLCGVPLWERGNRLRIGRGAPVEQPE